MTQINSINFDAFKDMTIGEVLELEKQMESNKE